MKRLRHASLRTGLLGVLMLAGCASTTPRPAAPAGEVMRPLVAPSAAGDRAVSQVVRGAAGAREMTINAVVSVKGDEMSVVGLNAMGVRLFTIKYDGRATTVEKAFALPEQLKPEWLLADLQFVFWPLVSLREPMNAAGLEVSEPTPATRRLRRGDRLLAEAHYAGADPWAGRSWLVNLEHGYSLQIDSEAP